MLQKLLSALYSTRLMALLFIGFAAAMAAGTFIEDAYNTETARIWIYNAWWFEAIMGVYLKRKMGHSNYAFVLDFYNCRCFCYQIYQL